MSLTKPRLLISGANGQVGHELTRSLAPLGEVYALDRSEFDLSRQAKVVATIKQIKPTIIINAAAYTAVDQAETDEMTAFQINGTGPAFLNAEAQRIGAALIHYSTDYVFDGEKEGAYIESDETNPLNIYGKTKRIGEKMIIDGGGAHLILRTSWVYDLRGNNFLNTMLRLFKERDQLGIVSDQIGCPTWSRMIAEATAAILARLQLDPEKIKEVSGIYHMSAAGQTSWHGFARHIAELAHQTGLIESIPTLDPIATSAYPLPAQRPVNGVMNTDKLANTLGIQLPDWETQLALCLGAQSQTPSNKTH